MKEKILLSVAGFDPTSGAGTVLDINVFQHYGYTGMGIITSLTAQNTEKVNGVFCPPPSLIMDQYTSLGDDIEFSGIKVGMLGSKNNITPVSFILSQNSIIPRVVDPVFRSSSGTWLLEPEAISDYMEAISGQFTVLTPNAQEAALITGLKVRTVQEMELAAKQIYDRCGAPCLITGGHFKQETLDVLFDGEDHHIYEHKKINTQVHGTGCFLSSALLSYLGRGKSLVKACRHAIEDVHTHIGKSVRSGKGQKLFTFKD